MTGQQLKNSILQEAIQGRLLPNVLQPGEKTGVELLQDILAERQKKENEEKGKKAKKLTLSTIEEEPWELPEGWCWCKLSDLFNIVSARRIHQSDWRSSGIPFYRTREIGWLSEGRTDVKTELFIEKSLYDKCKQSGCPSAGDIMLTAVGTVGKTYIVKPEDIFYYKDASVLCLENFSKVNSKYICFVIASEFFKSMIAEESMGTTVATITMVRANEYLVPLPPISIQKAIVARIEELFPLVDEYDKAAGELKVLNESLPDKLRKSVLQEAIHGTLVPNDIPEGEASAQDLLQQILEERQDRENKEKGKKAKKLTLSTIEEEPWELPEGWCWCQVSDIGDVITGSTPSKEHPEYYGQDVPFYKPSDLDQGISVVKAHDYLSTKGFTFARQLPELSILVTCIGATIGKVGLIRKAGSCNQQINAIIPERPICSQFLFYCIGSPYFQNEIKSNASATTLPILNKNGFASLSIPLPPLSIQHRIVEKIGELFSAINQLKA